MCDSLKHKFIAACKAGIVDKVSAAITLEIPINCQDQQFGRTGLMWCAWQNQSEALETIEVLLNHPDINVNLKSNHNETALMCACYHNNTKLVERIGRVPGLDVNALDNDGDTALLWAVQYGNIDCVKAMSKIPGVNCNVKNKRGNAAVMKALKNENKDVFKIMVEFPGVDLTITDTENKTLEQVAR